MNKEILSLNTKQTSLNISDTSVAGVRKNNITKTGIRIYDKGMIGAAGEVGGYDDEKLTMKALAMLDYKIKYDGIPTADKIHSLDLSKELPLTSEEFVFQVREIMKELKKNQPDFIFSNQISLVEKSNSLKNDRGLDLLYKDKFISSIMFFKHKSTSSMLDGSLYWQGRSFTPKEYLRVADETCSIYNNPLEMKLTGEKVPVIFYTMEAGYTQYYINKFASDLNANAVGSGASIFSDKIGKAVFNEDFTLYQTSDSRETCDSFFDVEGTFNEDYRLPLIEAGVIKTPYADKTSSKKYGFKNTGAAQCEYDGMPSLGWFTSFKLKEGDKTLKELLKGRPAVFAQIALGGDYNASGDFASPVQLAFYFDGEKITGRLPELYISSNIFDMFGRDFIGVTKDGLSEMLMLRHFVCNMRVSIK